LVLVNILTADVATLLSINRMKIIEALYLNKQEEIVKSKLMVIDNGLKIK